VKTNIEKKMEKRNSRCSVELRVLCFLNVVLLSAVVFLGYYSYSLEHRVRKLENQTSLVNVRVKRGGLDNVSSEELDYNNITPLRFNSTGLYDNCKCPPGPVGE